MSTRRIAGISLLVSGLVACGACRSGGESAAPPPDARRPQLQTEAELAAARQKRIENGQVVVQASPMLEAERNGPAASPSRPIAPPPAPGPVQSDILFVNRGSLSVAEVLYPLRDRIADARTTQTARGFEDQLRRWVRSTTQQEVGTLLINEKAMGALSDQQRKQLDAAVDREIESRASREFGGSMARLTNHLEEYGLSLAQYRDIMQQHMIVGSYTREIFVPQVTLSRAELMGYYRQNMEQYSQPETRELLMIEAPFSAFLPDGEKIETASRPVLARAKLDAKRQIRKAAEALATQDFRTVAKDLSVGPRASQGGSWGPIGQPLQPPYDAISALIFNYNEGQHSEPVESSAGWYIVGCGEIRHAEKRSFAEVQEEVRKQLTDQKFERLASDYVFRLAENATVSNLNGFIEAAVRRASAPDWPHNED